MKVDYKFLRDVLGAYSRSNCIEIDEGDEHKFDVHKNWFSACFCEVNGATEISLRGMSVYKFLCAVDDEFLAKVEPEGLYDLVNFWLIKKAEILVNDLQGVDGVLN